MGTTSCQLKEPFVKLQENKNGKFKGKGFIASAVGLN